MKKSILILISFVLGLIASMAISDFLKSNDPDSLIRSNSIRSNQVKNNNIGSDDSYASSLDQKKVLIEKIEKLTAEVESLKDTSKNNNQSKQKPTKEKDITDILAPDLLTMAKIRFDSLKRTQTKDLSEIFKEYPDIDLQPYENPYYEHLAQEKDSNWSYIAEEFLKGYFAKPINDNFKVLRIDCRTNSCEVAGLLMLPNELIELNLAAKQLDNKREISKTLMEIFRLFGNVKSGILHEPGYEEMFNIIGGYSNYPGDSFSIDENPYAHSFILSRANPDS